MSFSEYTADLQPGAPLSRAVLLTRRLLTLYAAYVAVGVLLFVLAALPIPHLPKLDALAREFATGGVGETYLAVCLFAAASAGAAALLTNSRLSLRRTQAALDAGELEAEAPSLMRPIWRLGPGILARQGQAILLTAAGLVIFILARSLWPPLKAPAVVAADANIVAALVIGLSFPSLIVERMTAGFPAAQMPEAPGLRRLLVLITLILAVAGVAEIGRGLGFGWIGWVFRAASILTLVLTIELVLRSWGRLFLPAPSAEQAKAATDSIIAGLLTGGPRAPVDLIKTHLGLDFARSWALSYLSRAAVPALVATGLFCWALTGVKLLGADQRGVYERLGAPVKVLGPGFHVLLPWPLGRLRPVEYGAVHTIAVGAIQGPNAFEKSEAADKAGAEDVPTPSMNRLWDTAHATEAEYLVASETGSGQQGFQMVNGEILVLWRTGLTDADAYRAVYGSESQATVVEEEANRLATRYFSSHTLDQVMGGQRERLQGILRGELATAVNADRAGVDIVAVLIDAIHPPAGAAAAYHAVQAAQINADASVAQATARATRTLGQAQQEAHQAVAAAEAAATEKMQAALGDAYQFAADRKAHATSAQAFILERRISNLTRALKGGRLMIVDHRLNANQVPLVDLRSLGEPAAAALGAPETSPGALPPAPSPLSVLPSTSSEGPPPPSTSEDAVEQANRARAARAGRNVE